MKQKIKKQVFKVHEQVSPCEKTVMAEFKAYQKKTSMVEANYLGHDYSPAIRAVQALPPLSKAVETLGDPSTQVRHDRLSEWEKSNFEKIFKTMDDFAKTKTIKRESLAKLFDIMKNDDTYLGKIPVITREAFDQIVAERIKEKKELSYLTFRLLLDDFGWRILGQDESQERVDKLYEKANMLLKLGKKEESMAECEKAISLSKHF